MEVANLELHNMGAEAEYLCMIVSNWSLRPVQLGIPLLVSRPFGFYDIRVWALKFPKVGSWFFLREIINLR